MSNGTAPKFIKILGKKGAAAVFISLVTGVLLFICEFSTAIFLSLILYRAGLSKEIPNIDFIPESISRSVLFLSLYLGGIGFLRAFFQFLTAQTAVYVQERVGAGLRLLYFDRMLYDIHSRPTFVEAQTLVVDSFQRASVYCYYLLCFSSALIQMVFIYGFLMFVSWKLTFSGSAILFVVAVIMFFLNKLARAETEKVPMEMNRMSRILVRVIRNILPIRIYRVEKSEFIHLLQACMGYGKFSIRGNFFGNMAVAAPQLFGFLILVGLIALFHYSSGISGAELLGFLYLFLRFVICLGATATLINSMNVQVPYFKMSLEFLNSLRKFSDRKFLAYPQLLSLTGNYDPQSIPKFEFSPRSLEGHRVHEAPAITYKGVSFHYKGHEESPVLRNLNLEIPAGSQFGIRGRSGSGKSTLLALTLGLIEPSKGEIIVADQRASNLLRRTDLPIAYVGPDSFLIEGSLRDNLQYGINSQVNLREMTYVLEEVGLQSLIERDPDLTNTMIAESGDGVSTGQKQRLSLARALLVRPKLLILDEVSANLDVQTEELILKAVAKLKKRCTTLIVSHRASFLSECDSTLDLEHQIS